MPSAEYGKQVSPKVKVFRHKIQLQMGFWGKIGGFCFLLKKENVHMTASNRKSDFYIGYTFTVVHKRTDVLTTKFYLNKQLSITKHMQI